MRMPLGKRTSTSVRGAGIRRVANRTRAGSRIPSKDELLARFLIRKPRVHKRSDTGPVIASRQELFSFVLGEDRATFPLLEPPLRRIKPLLSLALAQGQLGRAWTGSASGHAQ